MRRQSTEVPELIIPDVCYDDCNAPALEAQQQGLSPSLCAPNSAFMGLYNTCVRCIERFSDDTTPQGNDSVPSFSYYLEYCNRLGNSTNNITVPDISSLLESWSSLASTQAALQASLSSLGVDLSTITSSSGATSITNTITASPTNSASSTASATLGPPEVSSIPSSSPSNSDAKIIAPAVVVPAVILVIAAVIAARTFMRRRHMQRVERGNIPGDSYEGKAQLHADSFTAELDSTAIAKNGAKSSWTHLFSALTLSSAVSISPDDLAKFEAQHSTGVYHTGPSINTVLTASSYDPTTPRADFLMFGPKWDASGNSFRPAYFHCDWAFEEVMVMVETSRSFLLTEYAVSGCGVFKNNFKLNN
ncbi:hypothetical protein BDW59DRAFT_167540 [Aspergillus cavernicola]|uniref:Homogentisate 1,2-dioxygenase C-terminal domain-containing protein n=1 Tax=Aspergillus cavernicola TaxID=176166 RepID=A0ABR4HF26_9EURO